jgi:arsenate reductase-like glutaredoxin family protein
MSPGEIRFVDRFGLGQLLDTEGHVYIDVGPQYLRTSDADWKERISGDPSLLRLPLVRAGNRLSFGKGDVGWNTILAGG